MRAAISLLVIFASSLMFLGCDKLSELAGGSIEEQVAQDTVDQYNIAKRQGDPIQICVQAGLVAAAYLQAEDEPNYNRWKAIEEEDCEAAGVPR